MKTDLRLKNVIRAVKEIPFFFLDSGRQAGQGRGNLILPTRMRKVIHKGRLLRENTRGHYLMEAPCVSRGLSP
jgi:hypothetical protein